MTHLENDQLRITIHSKGAELTSLFNKQTGIEHLWQADPTVWGWHAPNLFPVVGGCLNNQVLIGEQAYPMERHGFARQTEFVEVESTLNHAVFSLRSSDATRQTYPYEFDFQLIYELTDAKLTVTYRLVNEGENTMYFSIGAHPAFNVPFLPGETYEDYSLEFENDETLQTHPLSTAGLFSGETQPVVTQNRELPLTKHLFDQDALVFKNLTSRQVTLKNNRQSHSVVLTFTDFPYLGLWAKPGAPFVCIEPWLGCADSEGAPVAIEHKEAIQHVEANKVFEAQFTIEIN